MTAVCQCVSHLLFELHHLVLVRQLEAVLWSGRCGNTWLCALPCVDARLMLLCRGMVGAGPPAFGISALWTWCRALRRQVFGLVLHSRGATSSVTAAALRASGHRATSRYRVSSRCLFLVDKTGWRCDAYCTVVIVSQRPRPPHLSTRCGQAAGQQTSAAEWRAYPLVKRTRKSAWRRGWHT